MTPPRRFSRPLSLTLALALALFAAPPVYAADDKDDKKDVPVEEGGKPPPDDGEGKDGGEEPERIRPFPGPAGLPMPPGGSRPLTGMKGGPPNMPPPVPKSGPSGPGGASDDDAPTASGSNVTSKKVPCVEPKSKITMDYVDAPLGDVVKYMAQVTCRNFILSDDLKGQVTIISHQQVSVSEAYEAFLSALEVAGYTTVTVGKNTKVVATSEAGNAPVKIYEGDDIPATDNFVTQIVNLENVNVSDISSVVKELAGPKARIIAYAPTNTLIITDAAYNIRRVYRIVMELDVAAPKSRLEVIPIRYATASDVERILAEVFSLASASSSSGGAAGAKADAGAGRRRKKDDAPAAAASATNIGSEGSYISKIISDERTNSLIVMANDDAIKEIRDLLARIDVDIDPASRSQIHVIYLENAKATDISSVLTDLSGSGSGGGSRGGGSKSSTGNRSSGSSGSAGGRSGSGFGGGSSGGGGFGGGGGGFGGKGPPALPGGAGPEGPGASGSSSAVAAFDNGVRITADENTNSLVIIAAPEDYRVLKGVIDRLDIMRRQVFVEAVVLEVGSEDSLNIGLGYHAGTQNDDGSLMYGAGGLGAATLGGIAGATGLATGDALSGLAMGIFGKDLEVNVTGPDGSTTTVGIPGFGIALNALAANAAVDILSNPSLLILDNEEAKINVGRNVPFPVSSGRDNNGQPIVSFQREDVGITLKVTPQINEANFVTLDLTLEVAEVEESSGGDASSGGFITSKRNTENVVVVKDNQTIVIGGLIGTTQTEGRTKVPILGDIPLIGVLFRGKSNTERKTNLLIFLTPHVINEPADLEEVYRIKWAQREEFMRRFYGKSRDEQQKELQSLLTSSMNIIDAPSTYTFKKLPVNTSSTIDKDGNATNDAVVRPINDPAATPTPEPTPEPAPEPAPPPVP